MKKMTTKKKKVKAKTTKTITTMNQVLQKYRQSQGKVLKRVCSFGLLGLGLKLLTSLHRSIGPIFRHQERPQFNSKLSVFTTQRFSGYIWIAFGYDRQQH